MEYLYMVFDSGYIFKFPAIKSNWAQQDYIVDNDELICPNREPNQYFNPIKESIIYDPDVDIFIIQV